MKDLIDRQEAIDALEDKYRSFGIFREQRAAAQCIDVIKNLPSAQPLSAWGGNPLQIDFPSAQQEIDELQKEVDYWHEKCTSYEQTIVRLTESAQPEIVRCKDCKWWNFAPDNTMLPDWHRCRFYGTRMHTTYEDFCSRGERRE